MNTNGSKTHVVIVGGGFAGLACARKLAKSDDVRVTLIDKNNFHQFQPLLYQLATAQLGTDDVATSLRQSLRGHANVDVKMAEVTAADPKTRTVTTREGQSYQGDFLVLAAGSQANFFGTTGARAKRLSALLHRRSPAAALSDPDRFRGRRPRPEARGEGRAEFRDRRRRTYGYGDGGGAGRHDQPHHDGGIPRPRGETRADLSGRPWARSSGGVSGEGPRLCRPGSPAEGCATTVGDRGERGSSRSCAAFRRHVDSNTHGGLGGWADGLAFGGKCGAAAGARRTDRSAAGPHG